MVAEAIQIMFWLYLVSENAQYVRRVSLAKFLRTESLHEGVSGSMVLLSPFV